LLKLTQNGAAGSSRRGAVRVHADVSRRDTILGVAALLVRPQQPGALLWVVPLSFKA
jgi:hypothetical protein